MAISLSRLPVPLTAPMPSPASLAFPGRVVIVASLALTLNVVPAYLSASRSAPGHLTVSARAQSMAVGVGLSDPSFGFYTDSSCLTGASTSAPVSQRALASGVAYGFREGALGSEHSCRRRGWIIPLPAAGVPAQRGRVILVSITQQWLWAYQDQQLIFANPVTTGKPGLNTPTGTYSVLSRVSDTTFYSPWNRTSPNYYAPQHIDYALLFRSGGYYIHDAPWRQMFGPGTNLPHPTPDGSVESGSHGCVNVTERAAAWLYQWAIPGTSVIIVA